MRRTIIFLTILTAAIFLYSGYKYVYGFLTYGIAAAEAFSRIGFLFGIGTLLICLFLFIWARLSRTAVYIHRDGLSFCNTTRTPVLFTWRQIAGCSYLREEYSLLFIRGTRLIARLSPNHGKPINLNKYTNTTSLPELVSIIKSRLYPVLEPELTKSFKAGQILYFGNVSISKSGIKIAEELIGWEVVHSITIKEGSLVISTRGNDSLEVRKEETIRLSLRHINNPELLMLTIRLVNRPGILDSQTA